MLGSREWHAHAVSFVTFVNYFAGSYPAGQVTIDNNWLKFEGPISTAPANFRIFVDKFFCVPDNAKTADCFCKCSLVG